MVHTLPPWTSKYRMITVFGQIDSGELAARLGNIHTYDRRGNVVWYDDFEDGLNKWEVEGSGDGYAGVHSITQQATGGASCKITGGSTLGKYCKIMRTSYLPPLSQIGIEGMVSMNTDVLKVEVTLYLYLGKTRYRSQARIDVANNDLGIVDKNNAFQKVDTDLQLRKYVNCFYPIKIVADYSTGKFVRLLFGKDEYDVSAYTMKTIEVAAGNRLIAQVHCFSDTGVNGIIYVDNVIITQNEP